MYVIMCYNVFNVWPKIILLPVWPRDSKRLDTPAGDCLPSGVFRHEEGVKK